MMSTNYSAIELIGNVGAAPESVRSSRTGADGARFSLAVNRDWTDGAGNRHEATDWYQVIAWGRNGEKCLNHLTKGRLIFVAGQPLQQRWVDDDDCQRERIQVLAQTIIFLDRPESEE